MPGNMAVPFWCHGREPVGIYRGINPCLGTFFIKRSLITRIAFKGAGYDKDKSIIVNAKAQSLAALVVV